MIILYYNLDISQVGEGWNFYRTSRFLITNNFKPEYQSNDECNKHFFREKRHFMFVLLNDFCLDKPIGFVSQIHLNKYFSAVTQLKDETMPLWLPGQPHSYNRNKQEMVNCAILAKKEETWGWKATNCSERHFVVCEKKKYV